MEAGEYRVCDEVVALLILLGCPTAYTDKICVHDPKYIRHQQLQKVISVPEMQTQLETLKKAYDSVTRESNRYRSESNRLLSQMQSKIEELQQQICDMKKTD